jgi:hypothetical protein
MRIQYIVELAAIAGMSGAVAGCGQSGLFRGNSDKLSLHGEKQSKASEAPLITEVDGTEEGHKSADSGVQDPTVTATPAPAAEAAPGPKVFEIPGTKPEELEALTKCLNSFSANPFPAKITNFKKMTAQIVIGGSATPIDDQQSTPEPQLILIGAAANYGANVTYNMLNRNGYYCMTLNVNVKTFLTINLHCHAQVADSAVAVQVNSTSNGSPSTVGVHVNSLVKVQDVRPDGEACIR